MKTYIADIIPKIQRFSARLDNLTQLTNQHWVVIDEISASKTVYIFRSNNELLISKDGKVDKCKWEYLGNNALLIDHPTESLLLKHGFLDENILALKVDGKNEYAFLVNENKYDGELNSLDRIVDFLTRKYLDPTVSSGIRNAIGLAEGTTSELDSSYRTTFIETDKGKLEIKTKLSAGYTQGDFVFLNGDPAPNGKYVNGWPSWYCYFIVEDGRIKEM